MMDESEKLMKHLDGIVSSIVIESESLDYDLGMEGLKDTARNIGKMLMDIVKRIIKMTQDLYLKLFSHEAALRKKLVRLRNKLHDKNKTIEPDFELPKHLHTFFVEADHKVKPLRIAVLLDQYQEMSTEALLRKSKATVKQLEQYEEWVQKLNDNDNPDLLMEAIKLGQFYEDLNGAMRKSVNVPNDRRYGDALVCKRPLLGNKAFIVLTGGNTRGNADLVGMFLETISKSRASIVGYSDRRDPKEVTNYKLKAIEPDMARDMIDNCITILDDIMAFRKSSGYAKSQKLITKVNKDLAKLMDYEKAELSEVVYNNRNSIIRTVRAYNNMALEFPTQLAAHLFTVVNNTAALLTTAHQNMER